MPRYAIEKHAGRFGALSTRINVIPWYRIFTIIALIAIRGIRLLHIAQMRFC